MDERTRGQTTKFTRDARTRRMLERLREGWGYRDVARSEGLSDRRVRQIVAAHVKRCEPVEAETHAALQIERLSFAVKVAGEALAKGDIRAITPFIKAIDRLDHYQASARKAAPSARSQEADALVVKALVDRLRREAGSEAAPSAELNPAAAPAPVLEAEPALPPIEPGGPHAQTPPLAAAEAAPARAEPDSYVAVETPPVGLAEPSPPPAEPQGAFASAPPALAAAPPPVTLAEPAPARAWPNSPLDVAAPPAVAAEPNPPSAPALVAPPFARPNMSNFAMSNIDPFFWR
jgi:hypothetical protein